MKITDSFSVSGFLAADLSLSAGNASALIYSSPKRVQKPNKCSRTNRIK